MNYKDYWDFRYNMDKSLKRTYCYPDCKTMDDILKSGMEMVDILKSFIPDYASKTILDFGCGGFGFCLMFDQGLYTGSDVVAGLINDNRDKFKGYNFVLTDFYGMPVLEKPFDIIFIKGVLQHFDDAMLRSVLSNMQKSGVRSDIVIISPTGSIEQKLHPGSNKHAAPLCRRPSDLVDFVIKEGFEVLNKNHNNCQLHIKYKGVKNET